MRCKYCKNVWKERLCSVCKKGEVEYMNTEKGRKEIWSCPLCGSKGEFIRADGSSLPSFAVGYICPACGADNTPTEDCFITTACVRARGLADDCRELTVIRAFRDEVLRRSPTLSSIVDEYYRTSPLIVSEIDSRDNSLAIYSEIYDGLVAPCVAAIAKGDLESAVRIYATAFGRLKERFL